MDKLIELRYQTPEKTDIFGNFCLNTPTNYKNSSKNFPCNYLIFKQQ